MSPRRLFSALALLFGATAARAAPDAETTKALAFLRPAVRAELEASPKVPFDQLPHYQLNLTLGEDLQSFALTEEVTFVNAESIATRDVAFRIFANRTLDPPPVVVKSAECVGVACTLVKESTSAFRILPKTPLARGASLRIRLQLVGRLRAQAAGETDMMSQSMKGLSTMFGGSDAVTDYGLLSYGDGIASLANFHAVLAERRGGTWVTSEKTTLGDLGPDEMAIVQAWVTTPIDVGIAVTGTATVTAQGAGKRTYSVSAGLIRDFALLASRDFVSVSRAVGDVTVRSHCVKGDEVAGMRVLDAAAKSLETFEARFGPYPYRDLDIVEAPVVGGAGGVEFSGLVTVASMFYRPAQGDLEKLVAALGGGAGDDFQNSVLEFTAAHEVAHQYWHGLVGSDSRRHAFVDESMAQWSTMLYLEERYGKAHAEAEAERHVLMNYRMMRMLGQPDGRVDRPVDDFGSPIQYAGLVYGKGAFLYSALRKAAGDAAYFDALRRYVDRYAFAVAPRNGFFDELAKSPKLGGEVRRLSQRYLEQAHGDQDLGGGAHNDLLAGLVGQFGAALGAPGAAGGEAGASSSRSGNAKGRNRAGGPPSEAVLLNRLFKALSGGGTAGFQHLLDGVLDGVGEAPEEPGGNKEPGAQ